MDVLAVHATMGAAAQSGLRIHDKLRSSVDKAVSLEQPPLAVVNKTDLGSVSGVSSQGQSSGNLSQVQEAVKTSGASQAQIVEIYELP